MYKPPVLIIFMLQSIVVLLAVLGLGYWRDSVAALSTLLGGALCILPAAYFGLRVQAAQKESGKNSVQAVIKAFYRAEGGKFILTLLGFALVFAAVRSLDPVVLFGSYSFCVILQWLLVARLCK